MSSRTSSSTGAVIAGDGGEGSPVETDPMGGNVGTTTPYIELLPPYQPPEQYPMLQSYFEDSVHYINGMRLACSLDGFAISCTRAFDSLRNGSAEISNLAQYNSAVSGLGIGGTIVEVPGTPDTGNYCTNGRCPNTSLQVYSPQSTFIVIPSFSVVSWNPRQQTPVATASTSSNQKKSKPLTGAIRASLNTCLKQMYGVELTGFTIANSTTGENGIVDVQTVEQSTGTYARPTTSYSVTTNVQFTALSFTTEFGLTPPPGAPGFTYKKRMKTSTGQIVDPSINYRLSDVQLNGALLGPNLHPLGAFLGATDLAIQIHELGNSLSEILNVNFEDSSREDPDNGEALDICVRNGLKKKRKAK